MEKKQNLRWISAALEHFLFCGILLGWHNFQSVFAGEGFFCGESSSNITVEVNSTTDQQCDQQFQQRQLIETFSIAVSVSTVSPFFFGLLTSKFGTVIIRLVLHTLWMVSFILFFIATPGTSDYLIKVGCCLLNISGLNLAVSNYPCSNLSGNKHGTVLSILSGAFDESAAMG